MVFPHNNSKPGQDAPDASALPPQAAGAAPAAPFPPRVIRGTSRPDTGDKPRTKVDYLTISCQDSLSAIRERLGYVFADAPAIPIYEPGGGMRRFERSLRVSIAGVPVGLVMWGGQTQRGRACVDVPGVGCGFVTDWIRAEEALLDLPERVWRRGDIAGDFFNGELTHDRVKRAHAEGKFKRGGLGPKLYEIRSSDENEGKTIYIGKRGGDQLGRFYEKGKQVFWAAASRQLRQLAEVPQGVTATDSNLNRGQPFDLATWYRAELELRSKNRPIPDDWISRRDNYFAGAYPFMEELLPEAVPEVIVRPREIGILAIERALDTVKRQWGAVLYTGLAYCGGDYVALCGKILGAKHSPRLVAAGALLALDGETYADADPE